jgi:uncharacterized protein YqfA (UPF0365 family)
MTTTLLDSRTLALILLPVLGVLPALWMAYLLRPWFKGMASGVPLRIVDVIGMRLRGVPPDLIIGAHIMTVKAGCTVSLRILEVHHLAGGHVQAAATAMVLAHQRGLEVGFEVISAADLAGRDVLRAVERDELETVSGAVDLEKELNREEFAQLKRTHAWLQSHRHRASILAFLRRTNGR